MSHKNRKAKLIARGCREIAKRIQTRGFIHSLGRNSSIDDKGKCRCAFGHAVDLAIPGFVKGIRKFWVKSGGFVTPKYLLNEDLFRDAARTEPTKELCELLFDLSVYNDTLSGKNRRTRVGDTLNRIAATIERDYR